MFDVKSVTFNEGFLSRCVTVYELNNETCDLSFPGDRTTKEMCFYTWKGTLHAIAAYVISYYIHSHWLQTLYSVWHHTENVHVI